MNPVQVLMCPPTYFEVRDVKNPFMANQPPVDRATAQGQWEDVCLAFTEVGVPTTAIGAVPGLEDMVFTNNPVFVGMHSDVGRFIVPSRMRFDSRQREVPYLTTWFRNAGYHILDLKLADDFLEGHGDLVWQPGTRRVWAGYGYRSSLGGIRSFQTAMIPLGIDVIPLQLVDPTFYHLDTCFGPLNSEAVLIYSPAFSSESLQVIQRVWSRVHSVSHEDAMRFACNGVSVDGCYIAPNPSRDVQQILRKESLEIITVDTSEFEKSGGSVCCLKLFFR